MIKVQKNKRKEKKDNQVSTLGCLQQLKFHGQPQFDKLTDGARDVTLGALVARKNKQCLCSRKSQRILLYTLATRAKSVYGSEKLFPWYRLTAEVFLLVVLWQI